MTAVQVLYLPRDDRLRSLVKLALDFVEEVYRDRVISDLRFVSFDPYDGFDVEQVKYIATREGFVGEVEHVKCEYEPRVTSFFWPHYNNVHRYVWIPISRPMMIRDLFHAIAHEVTHHVLSGLPIEEMNSIIEALRSDLGTDVDKAIERIARKSLPRWVKEVLGAINEITAIYIAHNYFINLEKEPKTPTLLTGIKDFAETMYFHLIGRPSHPTYIVLARIYYKMAREDLPSFREAVHGIFKEVAKRFPVEVLESNRAKYEILYRSGQII